MMIFDGKFDAFVEIWLIFMILLLEYCLDSCWAVTPSGNLVDGLPLAHSLVPSSFIRLWLLSIVGVRVG